MPKSVKIDVNGQVLKTLSAPIESNKHILLRELSPYTVFTPTQLQQLAAGLNRWQEHKAQVDRQIPTLSRQLLQFESSGQLNSNQYRVIQSRLLQDETISKKLTLTVIVGFQNLIEKFGLNTYLKNDRRPIANVTLDHYCSRILS